MDHGGDIDRAIALFGGAPDMWVDLSTGINRTPYPVPRLSAHAWQALPTRADMAALCDAARGCYGATGAIVALAGAQSAIQLLPRLRPQGRMKIIAPTYNEYATVFGRAGWQVQPVSTLTELSGADIAIVVNPNNPDGRLWQAKELLALRGQVGLLVVDESFMDSTPEHSLAGHSHEDGLLVLRSFGKFFGLAGVRLGFALGRADLCEVLSHAVGPWPVPGAGIEIALRALQDHEWIVRTRVDLDRMAHALDDAVRWPLRGGTNLFRLYETPNALRAQTSLASRHIWTRRFPWSDTLLRIGTPSEADLMRHAEFG